MFSWGMFSYGRKEEFTFLNLRDTPCSLLGDGATGESGISAGWQDPPSESYNQQRCSTIVSLPVFPGPSSPPPSSFLPLPTSAPFSLSSPSLSPLLVLLLPFSFPFFLYLLFFLLHPSPPYSPVFFHKLFCILFLHCFLPSFFFLLSFSMFPPHFFPSSLPSLLPNLYISLLTHF